MNIRLLRSAARAAALALLLPVLSACGGGEEPVVLGVAGPFSRANGKSMRLAAEMAMAEINGSGGIGGRPLELVFVDDSAQDATGLRIARALRADPRVAAVVGHLNSSVSLKAAEVYNTPAGENDSIAGDPLVQISPASSAPALTQAGPWTFRVTPTDLEFSPALAQWARTSLGRSRAAVLYANDEYGRGVKETFAAAFQRQGGTVVTADPYLPDMFPRDADFDAYLVRALGRSADALVIGGQADAGAKIIQAARRLGFSGPILGSDGLTGLKDLGGVGEGVFVSSSFIPDRADEASRRFVQAYQQRYDELPDHRGAMTYDILYLLRDAIREAGADRAAIRRYLESVTGESGGRPAYAGVSGSIRFDENGDVVGKPIAVGIVRGGRLVTAR